MFNTQSPSFYRIINGNTLRETFKILQLVYYEFSSDESIVPSNVTGLEKTTFNMAKLILRTTKKLSIPVFSSNIVNMSKINYSYLNEE